MHLLPKRTKASRFGLGAALRDARDTYRRYSGADVDDVADVPGAAPDVAVAGVADVAEPQVTGPDVQAPLRTPVQAPDPDVVVDIPNVSVDEIDLKLDELKARVALEARVLDLLRLDVGVDAELRGVSLQIKGVQAQALLKARLDNLTVILERVMDTIDANPQILERLTDSIGTTLDEIGSGTGRAVEEIGSGTGHAVGDLGKGAASAVDDVGAIARAMAQAPAQADAGAGPGAKPNGASPD
jgi:hypothetical protein